MPEMVAVNVIAVCAALITKVAVPNDAALAPPVLSVGLVGGFSWAFVRMADKVVCASACSPNSKAPRAAI